MALGRIWLLADDFPSEGNPVFVFVEQLVFAIAERGIRISVIAPQSITHHVLHGKKFLPKHSVVETSDGGYFEVFRPYSLSFGNKFVKYSKYFSFIARSEISRLLKKRYEIGDIFYGHFWHSAYSLFPFAEKYNAPLFVACGEGDDAMETLVRSIPNKKKKTFKERVNGVICVSSENKRKSVSLGFTDEDKTIVLPNCVNTSMFHPIDALDFRQNLGAEKDDFVIAFVGHFVDRKGYNRLSDAIDRLNNNRIKSIFVGSSAPGHDNHPTCNGIIFCGSVNHNDLPQYLCSSDVFVLPTLKEGCCNAIVEALACGIPVISSNRSFNEDILNENNSILINPEDIEDISSAIKELMENKDKYQFLRNNVLEDSKNHSISIRAEKILDFIQSKI